MKWIILMFLVTKAIIANDVAQRITLGTEAHDGMFPYMASIQLRGQHWCGGSIISPSWILTAAHCCHGKHGSYLEVSLFTVTVGHTWWRHGWQYTIEKIVPHPLFDLEEFLNDIALFKTSTQIRMGPNVQPIQLNYGKTDDDYRPIRCILAGWGNTISDGVVSNDVSEELRYVEVTTIPLSDCMESYNDIYHGQICIFSGNGKGSCSADSGSPLVSGDVQIGLVSFGMSCTNVNPEVYTRISVFYGWILEQMKEFTDYR